MNVNDEPRNWMLTKGAMLVSRTAPAGGMNRSFGVEQQMACSTKYRYCKD